MPLQLPGAVLSVLQMALALQFMAGGLTGFGIVMPGPEPAHLSRLSLSTTYPKRAAPSHAA